MSMRVPWVSPEQSGCSRHLETPCTTSSPYCHVAAACTQRLQYHYVYFSGLSSEPMFEKWLYGMYGMYGMIWYGMRLLWYHCGTWCLSHVQHVSISPRGYYATSESGFQKYGTDGTGSDECGTYAGNGIMILQCLLNVTELWLVRYTSINRGTIIAGKVVF